MEFRGGRFVTEAVVSLEPICWSQLKKILYQELPAGCPEMEHNLVGELGLRY
jgi:hypothetical protein